MEQIIDKILNSFDLIYMSSVIFSTWFVLYYLIKNPSSNIKIIISLLSGIIFGIIWIFIFKEPANIIVSSFFASIVLYSWIIKKIIKKLDIDYKNKHGIL